MNYHCLSPPYSSFVFSTFAISVPKLLMRHLIILDGDKSWLMKSSCKQWHMRVCFLFLMERRQLDDDGSMLLKLSLVVKWISLMTGWWSKDIHKFMDLTIMIFFLLWPRPTQLGFFLQWLLFSIDHFTSLT